MKDKMHKLDEKWNKCRPYLERINGTIVPLRSRSIEDHEAEERMVKQEKVEQPAATAPIGTAL
jgi:hypothetical protein